MMSYSLVTSFDCHFVLFLPKSNFASALSFVSVVCAVLLYCVSFAKLLLFENQKGNMGIYCVFIGLT